jgi:tetratricopeptide (TPR) repeat protein
MSSVEREPDDQDDEPGYAFESFRRAESLLGERRPLEALRTLEPVLEAQPEAPSVLLLAGRAFFHSAQLRNAQRTFERLLELDPADHYAHFMLGKTLQRRGELRAAIGQLRMAFAMYPLPEYQDALAEVAARLKLSDP